MPEETAIVKAEPPQEKLTRVSFAPTTFSEAVTFSKMVAASELAPRDFKGKPESIFLAIQMGAEVGLAPMQALQNIAVINGRPSLWGDAALAVVMAHRDYEWHKEYLEGEGDKRTGVFQIKRRNQEVHTVRFSVEDAKRANLWGKQGPWTQYPNRMLPLRARGFALRDKFADALRGMITAEEAADYPFTVDATPDDPEKVLYDEAEELLKQVGHNTAKRAMTLGQWKGRMAELVEKLKPQNGKETTCPASSSASAERQPSSAALEAKAESSSSAPSAGKEQPNSATTQSRPAPKAASQSPATSLAAHNAQPASGQTETTARTTPESKNLHGLEITDDDFPEGMFTDAPETKKPEPATPNTNGFDF